MPYLPARLDSFFLSSTLTFLHTPSRVSFSQLPFLFYITSPSYRHLFHFELTLFFCYCCFQIHLFQFLLLRIAFPPPLPLIAILSYLSGRKFRTALSLQYREIAKLNMADIRDNFYCITFTTVQNKLHICMYVYIYINCYKSNFSQR